LQCRHETAIVEIGARLRDGLCSAHVAVPR
jgi:hypothetical protein